MTDARKAGLPDFYAESIADPSVHVLVAEAREQDAERIVGTATGRIEAGRDVPRFGSLEDVWVEPEYRGRGICRAFVLTLAGFFQSQGVEKLSVGFVHGGAAAGLWQRLGFAPTVIVANSDIDTVMSLGTVGVLHTRRVHE